MQLKTLLQFENIVIQCHDDPDADAVASGFVLQKYLERNGKQARLVYSGPRIIRKENLTKMIRLFEIDITHVEPSELSECPPELLITVDCQDGESNVTSLPRREKDTLREVRSDYGACSTILWSMLKDAGFQLDKTLSSALYYGLYMDTVEFKSLSSTNSRDRDMRRELESGALDRTGIEQLKRANLNPETLRILGKAIWEIHIYSDYHFAVAQAQPCDPNILGVISDQIMEVDGVDLCVVYCLLPETERKPDAEFKFSVRSYLAGIQAGELAKYIANGLGGSAGGRETAAGGVLSERELKKGLTSAAEIEWDGLSQAVGRLIYRKIAEYCENSSELRKAYPEIAQKLEDAAYVRQLYDQAERGVAAAQSDLGVCCLRGSYVKEDKEQAVKWFRMAAEQGLAAAQHNLALCCYNGDGMEKDWAQSVKWFRKAAEQGLDKAQHNLGLRYERGEGVDRDPVQAVKWYRKAAEQGNAMAQTSLGMCYYSGSCVEQNLEEAAEWFRKAAEQDFATAQYAFGDCLFHGCGIEQNQEEGAEWYRRAAVQGMPDAQLAFGKCLEFGYGVQQDRSQAAVWYQKAAEQGYDAAQLALGQCFYSGIGVEKDKSRAAEWFRKAAEQNLADAQYSLGACYCNGDGVPRDLEQAQEWICRAAEQGHPAAKEVLEQLK